MYWQNGGQGPITHEVMSLGRFLNFAILENVCNISQNLRKLKVCINMDNDWMYHVYMNKGQGFITLRIMPLGRFSKN